MDIKRLRIISKRIGGQTFIIGFEDKPEQGFVADLEKGVYWPPRSFPSIFAHTDGGWIHYAFPKDKEVLGCVAQLKRVGE